MQDADDIDRIHSDLAGQNMRNHKQLGNIRHSVVGPCPIGQNDKLFRPC